MHIHGADVNDQSQDLTTALHLASITGHLEIVQWLVQHDVALDKTNVKQETPLHWACCVGDRNISQFLIEHGANMMSKDKHGDIPLHAASQKGQPGLVEIFIEAGVDVNAQNKNEETPLHLASGCGNLEVARFLIKHGADVRCHDKQGWTPLHIAAGNGHLNVVQLLLEHGADVYVKREDLCTSLHLASANGHLEVAKLIIECDAGLDVRNRDKNTLSALASKSGEFEITSGSNVNSQDNMGWTPLHTAASNGHLILVKLLLDSGADVDLWTRNTVTSSGEETAFDLAWKNGKRDVASFLARRSGNVCALDIVSSAQPEAGLENSFPDEIVEQDLNSGDSSSPSNSLHSAFKLESGQIDAVQRLFAQGATGWKIGFFG